MKRILFTALATVLVLGAVALSGTQKLVKGELQVEVEARNPWTGLNVNQDADTFHFAVVSDRTGGHRPRVFSQAVEQLNLLQPAFVISVGDLIEGYTRDPARLAEQWKELQTYTSKLQMPFFYVPGNHDLANPAETQEWSERFGRRYYHFVYRDVLFLAVCTDDPSESEGKGKLSAEQVEYFRKVLRSNTGVRWTVVCVHKPVWTHADLETNGWLDLEKALEGRGYTVFAGHIHRYQKFVRGGMNYYQLATTGGGSKMRGVPYGEFDHVAWVTVRKEGPPVVANVLLDGVLPESLRRPITDEEGVPVYNRKPTHPVSGKVLFEGAPPAGALVVFYAPSGKDAKKFAYAADGRVEPDGSFTLSSYNPFDGAPEGEYRVTVVWREPAFDATGKPGPNRLPTRYATAATTELTARVKTGTNTFTFALTR